ncbi:MAG: CPBP family intramembrane glutamic endopeptidase [Gammaproteobacteria bacterium]
MKYVIPSLMPLAVLISAASLACMVGYSILLAAGDIFPLDKVISKVGKLFLVLSIFPVMAWLGLNKRDLGFAERPVFLKQLVRGLGLGLLTLLPILIILFTLGVNVIDETRSWTPVWILKKLTVSFLLALLISIAEEPIFRGVLFAGLKKKMPMIGVVLISSLYYALLHFLDSHTRIGYPEMTLFSGFMLLGEALLNVFQAENIPAFSALFMVGVFLAVVRARIGENLGLCIGCHTAWVWQIKMNKSLFNTDRDSAYFFLASSYDGIIGPLVTVWLATAIIGYLWYRRTIEKA